MAVIHCDWYYENILDDNCNGNCEKCFGNNRNVYECTETFIVTGETLFDKVTIKKGSWWELKFQNLDHVLLSNEDNTHELRLNDIKFFDEHFKSLIGE